MLSVKALGLTSGILSGGAALAATVWPPAAGCEGQSVSLLEPFFPG